MFLSAWKYIVRNWKWIIMFILIFLLASACGVGYYYFNRSQHWKSESNRHEKNSNIYFEKASERVQNFTVTPGEARSNKTIDSLFSAYGELLSTKTNYITRVHEIQGETIYKDSVRIDTVLINGKIFNSIPIRWGCAIGTAYWKEGQDTAFTEGSNKLDLGIAVAQDRPKNWFINFKWNRWKWETKAIVINKCDSSMVWSKNLNIEISK